MALIGFAIDAMILYILLTKGQWLVDNEHVLMVFLRVCCSVSEKEKERGVEGDDTSIMDLRFLRLCR